MTQPNEREDRPCEPSDIERGEWADATREYVEWLESENDRLQAGIKRQIGASRTLRRCTLAEVQHLRDKDRSEYVAAKTLESEREMNAILTDRVESLEVELATHKITRRKEDK